MEGHIEHIDMGKVRIALTDGREAIIPIADVNYLRPQVHDHVSLYPQGKKLIHLDLLLFLRRLRGRSFLSWSGGLRPY